jgi:hypothetical protein
MPSTIPHLHHDTKLAIIIPYITCILRQIYDVRRWNYDGNLLSTHPSIEFSQNFPTEASPIVDIYSPTRGNGFILSMFCFRFHFVVAWLLHFEFDITSSLFCFILISDSWKPGQASQYFLSGDNHSLKTIIMDT